MKKINKELNLLPRKYRLLGFVLIVISALLIILTLLEIINIDRETIESISGSILLIGLLIIALTKTK